MLEFRQHPKDLIAEKLIGGYRMKQPTECPGALYDVMMQCWNIEAGMRPTFSTLCEILDAFPLDAAH